MASGRNRYSVISDGLPSQIPDVDPAETQEWLDSLDGVIDAAGPRRARFLMLKLLERAREKQVGVPALRSTDYVNTSSSSGGSAPTSAGTPRSWSAGPTR
jgi:pyruvate dehydrogenase E1 component